MSVESNIENIAFFSDFNTDIILGSYSGSFSCAPATVSPGVTGTVTVHAEAHGVSSGALPVMVWSVDNVSWYEAGSFDYSPGAFLDLKFCATVGVDNTNFRIVGKNFSGGTLTCYWRLVLIDG